MNILVGKKSFIVAALMLAVGLVNMLTGDASGMPMIMDNAMILLNGFGLAALRAGVSG
jgi:hypothetical protein